MEIVRKRCCRCGWEGVVPVRMRVCNRCPWADGILSARRQTRRPALPKAAVKSQDVAQRKLDLARKKVAECSSKFNALARRMRKWESKATYYAKRASMTDAEVLAEREARKASAQKAAGRKVLRGIKV